MECVLRLYFGHSLSSSAHAPDTPSYNSVAKIGQRCCDIRGEIWKAEVFINVIIKSCKKIVSGPWGPETDGWRWVLHEANADHKLRLVIAIGAEFAALRNWFSTVFADHLVLYLLSFFSLRNPNASVWATKGLFNFQKIKTKKIKNWGEKIYFKVRLKFP